MDTIMEGPGRTSHKTAIQRSGGSGMLILPWTKQILCVLWEHLRLLLQVVYYSFLAVFQMFRLEVHLRITDETGHHVQHVSTSGNPAESFILSSLFDGNNSVFIPGSSSLSKRGVNAGALLSGLRAEDLCLSLVDDFVIRAKEGLSDSDNDVDLCLGHHPAWERKDPGDWEVRVVEESERAEEVCRYNDKTVEVAEAVPASEPAVEQDESFWDEEDEEDAGAGEEFNNEESKALWESFMRSSDPYNPLSFSACISSSSKAEEGAGSDSSERDSVDSSVEEGTQSKLFRTHRLDLGRRGSLSETSDWDSSSDSGAEEEEENERLWELFTNPVDPYNPFHFTACATSASPEKAAAVGVRVITPTRVPSEYDTGEGESDGPSSSGEEEELWNSFSQRADPYHPLHFRACLQSSPVARDGAGSLAVPKNHCTTAQMPQRASRPKPRLPKRNVKHHRCLQTSRRPVPWRKPEDDPATGLQTEEKPALKKVRFSPVVQVHVMVAWSFALQAVRKGPWEEIARDRARFQRRIQETEQAIGYCLHQSHKEKILDYLCHRQNTPLVPEP